MKNNYFDIQVNGYGGIDFNQNDLTLNDLYLSCSKLKDDRVQGILATIITADFRDMILRIKKLVYLREQNPLIKKIIQGIHIEGPFLNNMDGFRGAHPKEHMMGPDLDKLKELVDAADGLTRIFTLAPEIDSGNLLTKFLHNQRIIVSAGHCDPDLMQLRSSIDSGLSMFTHLGNGCPQELHRHDNIIQKALSLKDELTLCFIADGIHIPFYALKNYLKIAGTENCIITTDAMAAAGAKPGIYSISNIKLEVGTDRIVREPGKSNFAGSAIDMKSSASNLSTIIGLSKEEVYQLTYANPASKFKI